MRSYRKIAFSGFLLCYLLTVVCLLDIFGMAKVYFLFFFLGSFFLLMYFFTIIKCLWPKSKEHEI